MRKNIEREIIKEVIKNSKSNIIHSHKSLKKNANKIVKSKEVKKDNFRKKEEKIKFININNKSLTDWNITKISKKILNNLPPNQNLYLQKKVYQASKEKRNNNCLKNIVNKKRNISLLSAK